MKCRSRKSAGRNEQGYILITLILFVALLAISLAFMAPEITQQLKRDREEELIHRGVQYSRGIQHFFKKFSRYPTTMEELESSNNLRFLRKRYKDPITGKDFKILHMGDVQMSFGAGLQGATSPRTWLPGARAMADSAAVFSPPTSGGTMPVETAGSEGNLGTGSAATRDSAVTRALEARVRAVLAPKAGSAAREDSGGGFRLARRLWQSGRFRKSGRIWLAR